MVFRGLAQKISYLERVHTRTPLPGLHHDWPCQVEDLDLGNFGKTRQDCQKGQTNELSLGVLSQMM